MPLTALSTQTAGGVASAAGWANVVKANFDVLIPAWTGYTAQWTAVTTPPNLGNGTRSSSYLVMGKTVFFDIRITMGSTTTFGTGAYKFGLPVTPLSQALLITASINNAGAVETFVAGTDGTTFSGQTIFFLYDGTTPLGSTNTHLVSGAVLVITGMYQAA